MGTKMKLIASVTALAFGVAAFGATAEAGGWRDNGGTYHAGGGNIPLGAGDGFGHGGGGGGGGGGNVNHGNGGGGGGGGFQNHAHQGGGFQGGGHEHHGGGGGWGAAGVGLGILGAGLAAGAIAGDGYENDDPADDDCYRYRPTYDHWGNYIGRRRVDICQ